MRDNPRVKGRVLNLEVEKSLGTSIYSSENLLEILGIPVKTYRDSHENLCNFGSRDYLKSSSLHPWLERPSFILKNIHFFLI